MLLIETKKNVYNTVFSGQDLGSFPILLTTPLSFCIHDTLIVSTSFQVCNGGRRICTRIQNDYSVS